MRYPVSAGGSKQEFENSWKIDQVFGNPTSYGFHEGADINLKTGGNSDLGQELKAIANGTVYYYHYASHPTYGFGRHLVLKITGDWGVRWAHYAHCTDQDFIHQVKDVNEGEIIARLGNSGTDTAHLHFSIFKVDPITIGGIDKIAKTQQQLNDWWEDPIAFINNWSAAQVVPPAQQITDQSKYNFGEPWGEMEMQAVRSKLNDMNSDIVRLSEKIENAKNALN